MIQPSMERTATAPEEVCWSVVEGLEPLRGGELSMSMSGEAMGASVVWGRGDGVGLGRDVGGDDGERVFKLRVKLYECSWSWQV